MAYCAIKRMSEYIPTYIYNGEKASEEVAGDPEFSKSSSQRGNPFNLRLLDSMTLKYNKNYDIGKMNDFNMQMYGTTGFPSGYTYCRVSFATSNDIDFTRIGKIKVNIQEFVVHLNAHKEAYLNCILGLSKTKPTASTTSAKAVVNDNEYAFSNYGTEEDSGCRLATGDGTAKDVTMSKELELDVSSVRGSYYLYIIFVSNRSYVKKANPLIIDKITLTPKGAD